ncbi:MAG: FG-GAP repeat protein [Thermoanaerobaculales bacterium]|jgi:hypothetical protein|nr:FG-GAP repeat protein [Thermoanaerobaculales bacterium]
MTETRLSSRSRDGLRIVRRGAIAVLLALPLAVAAAGPPAGVSPDEWAGIEQQIEAERHRIAESDRPDRLWRAANPTQRFTAQFGAEDVVIEPAGRGEPAWRLGLRLTAWGAAHDLQQVEFASVSTEGNRVEYRRGPLTEWYLNTSMGLVQGFTIVAPPDDDITELVLEMTLDGDLNPVLSENGESVTFRQEGTNTSLVYSGIKAWDAVDEVLATRIELTGGGTRLLLVIEVEGAAWPLTVDPVITLVEKLVPTPELNTSYAEFGRSVSVDGDLIVVGMDDLENGEDSGAAHVFRRDGGTGSWGRVAKLTASDGAPDAIFGWSVAIDGDTAIVGAFGAAHAGVDSGCAYVFQRDHGGPDAWGQVVKLVPADGDEDDYFGKSVSITADTAIIGAPSVNDNGYSSGSAYLFRRDQGGVDAWGQVAKITPDDGAAYDSFGCSVSIDGDTAIVGAQHDNDNGSASGSA